MFEYDDLGSIDSIGSILRQQRESKKLSLDKVAEELKIRPQYLEALEKDQFELLPGKLYLRSFLKAYAQFLNLDQDHILEMLDQYESPTGSYRKELEGTFAVEKKTTEESKNDATTLPVKLQFSKSRAIYGIVILVGLAVGIFCLMYITKPGMKKKQNAALELSAALPESQKAVSGTVDTTSFAWRLDDLLTPSTSMILRIKAKKDSWVKVIADDKTLFSGIITVGMTVEFEANDYFSINLGTSAEVETYLNGMKMNPLEKGTHRLDRKNYKSFFSAGSVRQDFKTP